MAPVAVTSTAPGAPGALHKAIVDQKVAAKGSVDAGIATPYSATSTAVSEAGDKSPAEPVVEAKDTLVPGQEGYFEALLTSNAPLPSTTAGETVYGSALEIVEALAVQNSSAVWVYDDAVEVGFGARLAVWDAEGYPQADGKVHPVQTREGAGLELAGFATKAGGKISVFASATTLPFIVPNLASIKGDVVIHVAATAPSANLELDDALAAPGVLGALAAIQDWDVVFSAGAEVAQTAAHLYNSSGKVIHVIESTYSARDTASFKFPSVGAFEEFVVSKGGNEVYLAVASHAASLITAPKVVLNTLSPSPEKLFAALAGETKRVVTVTGPTAADAEALKAVVLAALYQAPTSSTANFPTIKAVVTPEAAPVVVDDAKVITFFTAPASPLPQLAAQLFFASPQLSANLAQYGSVSVTGTKSVLALSQGEPVALSNTTPSDLIWVSDVSVHRSTDILATAKEGATVVLELPWEETDLSSKLTAAEIQTIQNKNLRVFLLDLDPTCPLNPIREQVAFLLLYTGSQRLPKGVWKVLDVFHNGQLGRDQVEDAQAGLFEVPSNVVKAWEVDPEKVGKTKDAWSWDGIAGEPLSLEPEAQPRVSSWDIAARHLFFREAYSVPDAPTRDSDETTAGVASLRPELEEETFLVTVSENRRLTPLTYDRNVFHLELDTSGTGLRYEIGEAIGIHGWNEADEVADFCKWYGLDPESVITSPNALKDGTEISRSVFQLLQQNLDLFGQPGKQFYADLAKLATKREEAMKLKFISSPEGAELFQRMAENETVNFADVLREFPSAHPSIERLIEIIPEIKPRHYSIASSQAAVGDKVELLIVTVDWKDSHGRERFGQCTRYLANLAQGQQVTVSIKPSVMKLPPHDSNPLILAGLGTGAAPFRAFMQHRAWQESQGIKTSKIYYFFGSRHRSQEYLYGEDIEAYVAAGIIGHAGLAFSRDGPNKVYIQHKIHEAKQELARMLLAKDKDAGYFYLCGPTWPVPDVFEALATSLAEEGNMSIEEAEKYLEDLKEEERYVLEVY